MGDLLAVLQALQSTPIPNLLVVAGFVFLFLAFVGRFGAFISLPQRRQLWAGVIGVVLLFSGIGLFMVPSSTSTSTSSATDSGPTAPATVPRSTVTPTVPPTVPPTMTPTLPPTMTPTEPPPQPTSAIDSFTANPHTLSLGQCITLSWGTTNVVTAIVLEGNGQTILSNLPPSGSASHCPPATGEYVYNLIVTAGSTQGPVSATAVVRVEPKFSIGSKRTRTADGMTMFYVPDGTFKMGSDNGESDEKPIHEVKLDAFWIDSTEVTNAQYARCVTAGQCAAPSESKSYTRDSYYGNNQYANYPVIYVSSNNADKYCQWVGGQLPTEAQWEYAAKGPQGFTYPWGNDFDGTRLNFCDKNCLMGWADKMVDDGYTDTAPVGNYPNGASWVGAFDMAGNVWERVKDWYTFYPDSPQTNPVVPTIGNDRVLRGGSFGLGRDLARTASRFTVTPDLQNVDLGFRCVVVGSGG